MQGYLVLRFLSNLSEESEIGVPSYRGFVGTENLKFRKTKSSCIFCEFLIRTQLVEKYRTPAACYM